MLVASHIHFCIRKQPIIQQADLSLSPGQFTVILGPNGAGKSTLLKVISGEIPCSHGEVRINGKNIYHYSPADLARVRAVMPQSTSVSFPFKAAEVVELGLQGSKELPPAQILQEVMELTNTLHLADRYYGDLSGGEKQRVQLARVLAQVWDPRPYPRYVLLDEPTSSLDLAQQHQVMKAASQLKQRNIGILAIVHDINLALEYADQLLMMKRGLVAYAGPAQDLLQESIFEEVYDHPVRLVQHEQSGKTYVISAPGEQVLMKQIQIV
jgi:iron complex transport system ATP-binding protein